MAQVAHIEARDDAGTSVSQFESAADAIVTGTDTEERRRDRESPSPSGRDADALAEMYGHRCATMEMLVSSVHPHAAGVQVELVDTLLDFGAAVDGVENNGSPLMTAFRFHYPKAAAALVNVAPAWTT